MKISAINPTFTASGNTQEPRKRDFLNNFYDKARNAADMTDTVLVPRTIFKGYLWIMSGTTLATLGTVLSKHPKISKPLSVTGLLASLYGAYAFVRPFIIKDTKGVETKLPQEDNINKS